MGSQKLRVASSPRVWRRVSAVFISFLVVYTVVVFVIDSPWQIRLVAVLLLGSQVSFAVIRLASTDVTSDGLDLNVRVRRRLIRWEEINKLQFGGPHGRPTRVFLVDGSEVKSFALVGFKGGPEVDPVLLDRLQHEAENHDFTLIVE